uniref:Uncharacterized protein n=1 Tax=Wolbachia endosymbiont of Aleurodicus dispersus TaxID=1288877 RepID=A0A3B0JD74_9RICK
MGLKDVTGQELRYIYRNWDKVENNVIFWRNRRKVVAPWKSTELANVYEKNSDGKFEIKGQKILAQIWSEYKPKVKAVNSNEQTRSSNIRRNPNRG